MTEITYFCPVKTEQHIDQITIERFNYHLPEVSVAKYPLEERDQSKLLVWRGGAITDEQFINLPQLLPAKSLLIFNNTKVIRARLLFTKDTGSKIEIFVLDPFEPADYSQNFQQTTRCSWTCMVGNLKKWKGSELTMPIEIDHTIITLRAENIGSSGNSRIVVFSWDNAAYTFANLLEVAGNMPIPPYLNRESEEIDQLRYQTVYSKVEGSVAAPTAGLHFTNRVFGALEAQDMSVAELTLHVGAGTFQPVKSETIDGHLMHTEHIHVQRSFIELLLGHKHPVISVGTTSVRTLESLYWMGVKAYLNPNIPLQELKTEQWEPYHQKSSLSKEVAFKALLKFLDINELDHLDSSTQIIIVPGYEFRVIDGMITNFHQPQSTLLLLVSAFVGNQWEDIYQHALANNYRFLSYGDSNLYLR